MRKIIRLAAVAASIAASLMVMAPSWGQTRAQGPWWPSKYGPEDQAGASNTVTAEKILEALAIPRLGQTYELGHLYEPRMPQYGERPYYLATVRRETDIGLTFTEYFTGYIGQMGTQFDALGHQGRKIEMADGSSRAVFYNGFSEHDLIGKNHGQGGLEALGVEHMKPFITRGLMIDIAGYKAVESLAPGYEVTLADVRGALARQGMSEAAVGRGDAVLFNYGWAMHWGNPSKYNDSYIGRGENEGSPGIYGEVARWLIARDVALVGADSCCVEVRPTSGNDNVHHLLFLEGGIPLLENLELRELARDRVYEFLLLTLPERIKGATGSPVRPIAVR